MGQWDRDGGSENGAMTQSAPTTPQLPAFVLRHSTYWHGGGAGATEPEFPRELHRAALDGALHLARTYPDVAPLLGGPRTDEVVVTPGEHCRLRGHIGAYPLAAMLARLAYRPANSAPPWVAEWLAATLLLAIDQAGGEWESDKDGALHAAALGVRKLAGAPWAFAASDTLPPTDPAEVGEILKRWLEEKGVHYWVRDGIISIERALAFLANARRPHKRGPRPAKGSPVDGPARRSAKGSGRDSTEVTLAQQPPLGFISFAPRAAAVSPVSSRSPMPSVDRLLPRWPLLAGPTHLPVAPTTRAAAKPKLLLPPPAPLPRPAAPLPPPSRTLLLLPPPERVAVDPSASDPLDPSSSPSAPADDGPDNPLGVDEKRAGPANAPPAPMVQTAPDDPPSTCQGPKNPAQPPDALARPSHPGRWSYPGGKGADQDVPQDFPPGADTVVVDLPAPRGSLPRQRISPSAQQKDALRAAAQTLPLSDPAQLQPALFDRLQARALEGPRPAVAVLAAGCLGMATQSDLPHWRAAASLDKVDLGHPQATVILDPPAVVRPNVAHAQLASPRPGGATPARLTLLPLPRHPWTTALLSHAATALDQGGPLFDDAALVHARGLLKGLTTFPRLASLLGNAFYNVTGDDLVAALVCGKPLQPSLVARASYASYGNHDIAAIHARAMEHLVPFLGTLVTTDFPLPDHPSVHGAIGSQLTPALLDVRTWVEGLSVVAGSPPRGRPTAARIIPFHNRFTAYTATLFLWSTGVRPTYAGLQARMFDGMVVVDDKPANAANTRCLPMARVLQHQMRHYDRHHAWMCRWLGESALPRWFLLDNGRVEPLTPRRLLAASASPFAENANRHFLVSQLAARGMRRDRINLITGHRRLGDDAGAPFQSAEPLGTHDRVHLDALVEEMGWHDLQGMARP